MPLLEALFGRSQTPAERLRAHLRSIQRARRELDRERVKLEGQEKTLMADIKKNAKQGQMAACKVMARDLVRVRRNIHKFYQMSTQLQAVGLRMQTLRSTQQMSEAMRGASKALGSMNRSMNIMAVQRILQEFERETSTMDMKDEMMNDTMEDALGGEEDAMGEGIGEAEESDTILRQVLDEIGVSVNQQWMEQSGPRPEIPLHAMDERAHRNLGEVQQSVPAASGRVRCGAGFFTLGLLNNLPYVVILTAALELLPSDVPTGVLAFVNIAPALVAKAVFPYLLKGEIRYTQRVLCCVSGAFGGMLVTALFPLLFIRLLGVGTASFMSGLGEITYLQYTTRYPAVWDRSSGAGGLPKTAAHDAVVETRDEAAQSLMRTDTQEEEAVDLAPSITPTSLSFAHKMELLRPMLLPYILPLYRSREITGSSIPKAWLWVPALVQFLLLFLLASESIYAWFRESIARSLA
ncbi:ESCRT-III subunit protein did4 [Malassezia brasiliensis]|uniref:ESCRT-III subunit protein did4 n=1 Tax=Malassezia brasiliensis TaxID=1821822 RepID=A0AAF0DXR0_9BASI|nr:ESCRT-III subunit protein did4 [Malassezia brasiliensis]